MQKYFYLLLAFQLARLIVGRNFTIDYENNTFLKDGKPFRYMSGSIHYNRIAREHWQDRLLQIKAAGLNTISTYIPWNVHEPKPGVFDFSGNLEVFAFLDLASQLDLLVILRVGPYTCAGFDFGGLAGWLMEYDDIVVRTNDPVYMKAVYSWLDHILPALNAFLYENGGSVISVQIENEYGSQSSCDQNYLINLRDRFRLHLGETVVLFTTDNASDKAVKCGKIHGVYATVDFGLTNNPDLEFAVQRKVEPKGPLVCSEFYVEGNIDYWGKNFSYLNYKKAAIGLDILLNTGANVNLYMVTGGTNFAYNNGGLGTPYLPSITSYDHDSPVSEAGQLTPKYYALREVIQKHFKGDYPPVPKPPQTYAYGPVKLHKVNDLFDVIDKISVRSVQSKYPLNMEKVQQYYGYILYEHVSSTSIYKGNLTVPHIRDRGYIFVNQILVSILQRDENNSLTVTIEGGEKLHILVENQGRLFGEDGMRYNQKGLIQNVTINNQIVTNWMILPLNLSRYTFDTRLRFRPEFKTRNPATKQVPAFYSGTFTIPKSMSDLSDTFINVQPFHKGQLFINSINIGKYWPDKGPQVTLYIPKSVLKPYPVKNVITLFELERSPCYNGGQCVIKFVDKPILNKTVISHRENLKSDNYPSIISIK